jgi:hypothetical protein
MTTISQRIIGLPEQDRNRKILHPNPTFSINHIKYDRYQNKKIFQITPENTPSINTRIGMSQNTHLIAHPCDPINDRLKIRTASGFRVNHFEVRAKTGLNKSSYTPDRLYFSANLKQTPLINKIY